MTHLNDHDNKLFKAFALYAERLGKPLKYIQGHLILYLAARDAYAETGIQMFHTSFAASHFGPMISGVGLMAASKISVGTEEFELFSNWFRYTDKYIDIPFDELKRLAYDYPDSPWEIAYNNGAGADTLLTFLVNAA